MSLKQEIKDFMNSIGVEVVNFAGPGRFDGPPSLDPEYVLKGAKSVVCFAIPMDVPAIYDFLSKKTAVSHNIDQFRGHQRMMHIAVKLVDFIRSKGYQAEYDVPNSVWRKTVNPLAMTPRFSHRYAAIVSGLAGMGLSGNVVNEKYGASMYINSVITDAVLESDPMIPARKIFDETCQHCMACAAACPTKMFENHEEEYSLLNGELYPRGKKRDVYLCTVEIGAADALNGKPAKSKSKTKSAAAVL